MSIKLAFNKADGSKNEFTFEGKVGMFYFLEAYISEYLIDNKICDLDITITDNV